MVSRLSLHLLYPVWTAVDNFIYLFFCCWWTVVWSRSFSVWICSCLLHLLPPPAPHLEPAPPPLTDWCGSLLPRLLTCGPAFWLARAAVSCAWSNHVAPPIVKSHGSVKRQGPLSTHPPAPPSQSHILEQKQIWGRNNNYIFAFLCLICGNIWLIWLVINYSDILNFWFCVISGFIRIYFHLEWSAVIKYFILIFLPEPPTLIQYSMRCLHKDAHTVIMSSSATR